MEDKKIIQVIDLVSKATGINKDQIQKDSRAIDFDKWDSLSNLKIVLALEKKLKKKLNATQVSKIDSVNSIIKLIS